MVCEEPATWLLSSDVFEHSVVLLRNFSPEEDFAAVRKKDFLRVIAHDFWSCRYSLLMVQGVESKSKFTKSKFLEFLTNACWMLTQIQGKQKKKKGEKGITYHPLPWSASPHPLFFFFNPWGIQINKCSSLRNWTLSQLNKAQRSLPTYIFLWFLSLLGEVFLFWEV